jgi:hypothetical protein
MNKSNNLGMMIFNHSDRWSGEILGLFLAKRSAKFFLRSSSADFYKYPMQIYIIFITACAVFAVFYLRRDRSKDAERQRLSDLY